MPNLALVPPDDSRSVRAAVRAEIAGLSEEAAKVSLSDLHRGVWFPQLLDRALEGYRRTVDAEFFETRYPGLARESIVDRRIDLAKRYAAFSGGFLSMGAADPFAVDLFFVTQLQLRITYDISVLYGRPIDLGDPEDLILLVGLACGARAGRELRNAAVELTPEVVQRDLPLVGARLLRRNLIKMAIPGVVMPLCSGINYFTTGRTAATARGAFRDRTFVDETSSGLLDDLDESAMLLLLQVIALVVHSDGKVAAPEAMLLDSIVRQAVEEARYSTVLEELRRAVDGNEEAILERLERASPELRSNIYDAACLATAVDRRLKGREEKQLRRIAEACRLQYDRRHVRRLIERLEG